MIEIRIVVSSKGVMDRAGSHGNITGCWKIFIFMSDGYMGVNINFKKLIRCTIKINALYCVYVILQYKTITSSIIKHNSSKRSHTENILMISCV